ncbi:polysaccharide deacetylase family protein [Lysinibacillus xylanilyticus]|uniref:stalk domain-containing protein n=1 Tax=Lysinibacillus xylanilyticus TaxID=582475 RepID=UPI002B24D74C|nr:polysaccharide deacetylase family protein [Lysinibacillus xylanilyticus]MEB2280197.1 polysaccharide deacetylase family protein [Lysinibacillus xylanilyticus]
MPKNLLNSKNFQKSGKGMSKKIISASLALAIGFGALGYTEKAFAGTASSPDVYVNGKQISFTADSAPELLNGTTMVPISQIIPSMGATVVYNGTTKESTITDNDGTVIKVTIGSKTAYKNGVPFTLSQAPYIKGGRTMVPTRTFSQGFNKTEVNWDGSPNYVVGIVHDTVKFPIIMYHSISSTAPTGTGSGAEMPTSQFAEQIAALKNAGYDGVSFDEYLTYKTTGNLPAGVDKPIIITFDDGYENNYTEAFPILQQYGMKATMFVVSSQMGQTPGYIKHFDWNQAQIMKNSGLIDIQSHTHDLHKKHDGVTGPASQSLLSAPYYNETQKQYEARIKADLQASYDAIKNNVGIGNTQTLAYPYGQTNATVEKVALEVGFDLAPTVKFGVAFQDSPRHQLDRITANEGQSGSSLLAEIDQYSY